jgi:hypothetical protein
MTIRKLFALVALLCIPCACAGLTPLNVKRKSVPALAVTGVKHVVLVILENGSPKTAAKQEFMKLLEENGTRLDQYFAVAHPSQPNYVALISGSAKDALTDGPIALDRPHLGRILGKRWKVYADGYPAVAGRCFLGKESGVHRKGYVRRHVPFLSFVDVQKSDCAQIVRLDTPSDPVAALRADIAGGALPDFALLIPDLTHDGHEPSDIPTANKWLMANIGPLLHDPKFTSGLVFILTFDEDDSHGGTDNRVYTVISGDRVKTGVNTDVYDHYDLLATIAALLNVTPPPLDEPARPIGGIWK